MFEEHAVKILVFSTVLISLMYFLKRNNWRLEESKLFWFGQVIFTFLVLITGEIVLVDWFTETAYVSNVKIGFDMLWWLVPAYLINLSLEPFIWTPIGERYKRFLPNAIRTFTATIIYALAVLGIIIFVYESPIIIVSIVLIIFVTTIGFYIHQTWASFLVDWLRRFRIGDWVKIGEFEEGEVVDITWRDTRIKTRDESIVAVPSCIVLQSTVKNFCYPDNVYWSDIKIKISDAHTLERVKKILLDAALSSNKILKEPSPVVIVTDMSNGTIEYTVAYCSDDYSDKMFIKENMLTRIWHHLKQADIAFKGAKERDDKEATKLIALLKEIEIFEPFPEKAKLYLSERIRQHRFGPGDIVVKQGDAGDSLFVIIEGVVAVQVQTDDGRIKEVARLGVEDFFGERSLFTGEERTATFVSIVDSYLFELTKADIAPLIVGQPELAKLVSKVFTQRQMMTQRYLYDESYNIKSETTVDKQLLNRIENFFGIEQT
jgi:branched-chain amino acid transport system substrate-binding protein